MNISKKVVKKEIINILEKELGQKWFGVNMETTEDAVFLASAMITNLGLDIKEEQYNQIREWLSEKEHAQGQSWSQAIVKELKRVKIDLEAGNPYSAREQINNIIDRWEKNWKPYKELDEETKEFDREWADIILHEVPFKCPLDRCGGIMKAQTRELPKQFKGLGHYKGDEQSPDLVCTNCGAVYQFQRFIGQK